MTTQRANESVLSTRLPQSLRDRLDEKINEMREKHCLRLSRSQLVRLILEKHFAEQSEDANGY